MLKEQNKWFYLISSFLLFSCSQYKGDLTVIKAKYEDVYSYPCTIYDQNKKLNISNIRKYRDGKLIEYQGCASEGLYTENFESNNEYSKDDLEVKYLSLKRIKKHVMFFNKKYEIEREHMDTIFAKSDVKNEYFIFIGNLNQ
jgi:hypothetical protein